MFEGYFDPALIQHVFDATKVELHLVNMLGHVLHLTAFNCCVIETFSYADIATVLATNSMASLILLATFYFILVMFFFCH